MKNIYLAKKSKRIFARLIDMTITFSITALFFLTLVVPLTLDQKTIRENNDIVVNLYKESGLFLVDAEGNYCGKAAFDNISTLDKLYSNDCNYNYIEYKGVNLSESLYIYYTQKLENYGVEHNLTLEVYEKEILQVGTLNSNIKSFDSTTYKFTLINEEDAATTIDYIVSRYNAACQAIINSNLITKYTNENTEIVTKTLVLIIPVLIAVSFIFDLLIPLFTPQGKTIGKFIFKLGVISQEGYQLKKYKLIIRWLTLDIVEYIGGTVTFGGLLLISYTMFLFTKKRRCIHDYISKSCVIDSTTSIVFTDAVEEKYYLERKNNI